MNSINTYCLKTLIRGISLHSIMQQQITDIESETLVVRGTSRKLRLGGLQRVARIKLRSNTNLKSLQISTVKYTTPTVILHAYTESIIGKTLC